VIGAFWHQTTCHGYFCTSPRPLFNRTVADRWLGLTRGLPEWAFGAARPSSPQRLCKSPRERKMRIRRFEWAFASLATV
jgi:hypothetical protein